MATVPNSPNKRPLAAIVGTIAAGLITLAIPKVEGEKLTAYQDVVKVWTNCAGNTHNVVPGSTLTAEQCKEIDSDNAATYAGGADKCLSMKSLRPGQRVAVTLFAINEGVGAYCGSQFRIKLAARDPAACDELGVTLDTHGLPKWTTAGGRYYPGLQNRRNIERAFCKRTDLTDGP